MRRLCIHTITNKLWSIEQCIERHAAACAGGITLWRYNLEGRDPAAVGRRARDAGLEIVSLCRGSSGSLSAPRTHRWNPHGERLQAAQQLTSSRLDCGTVSHSGRGRKVAPAATPTPPGLRV
jgi:sugar phosphate isomerase/epimerase